MTNKVLKIRTGTSETLALAGSRRELLLEQFKKAAAKSKRIFKGKIILYLLIPYTYEKTKGDRFRVRP